MTEFEKLQRFLFVKLPSLGEIVLLKLDTGRMKLILRVVLLATWVLPPSKMLKAIVINHKHK
jgi:hypothetical protein